ncbi:MAG: hypothetical protein ACUVV6_07775 [Thermoplasmatota archaeon]
MARRVRASREERASKKERASWRQWLVKLVAIGIILLFLLSSLVAIFAH